jgi:hypothetical protein
LLKFIARHQEEASAAPTICRLGQPRRAYCQLAKSAAMLNSLAGSDEAFDSNTITADLDERGAKVVIAQHPRRASPRPIDEEMYKWRHLIENFFDKLKEFKCIAMRADKTDDSFTAMIYIAAAVINSR